MLEPRPAHLWFPIRRVWGPLQGTAFEKPERDRLRLRGLLPSRVMTMEAQIERLQDDYFHGKDWVDLNDPSVTRDHVRKWRVLSELKVEACHSCYHHSNLELSCTP